MYNEEKGAAACVSALDTYLSKNFEDYEIVAVNDGSRDGTEAELFSLAEKYPHLKPVTYKDNRGKGCAVRTGILASSADMVVYTDCDLAYGTDIISEIVKPLDSHDIVIGSRNLSKEGHKGYSFIRKLASKVYIKLLNFAAGFDHSDSQCGIKCYKGEVARRIFALCQTDGFAFDLEVLILADRLGYPKRQDTL